MYIIQYFKQNTVSLSWKDLWPWNLEFTKDVSLQDIELCWSYRLVLYDIGCILQNFPHHCESWTIIHNPVLSEPAHDTDHPVHSPSMSRVLVRPSLDSPEAVEGTYDWQRHWSDCTDAQADLSLCWSHKSYCRFCHALAHIIIISMILWCRYNRNIHLSINVRKCFFNPCPAE